MQQKLNDAYQSGDIQTLLEMERMYLLEEIDLSEAKAYTVDVLQQAISKLEKELDFINNQISRCQGEIKNLRNSEFGAMLTDLKRAKKEGFGFDEQMAEMENMLQMLTQVRDALKDCVEEGKISESFMKMAMGGMGGPMGGFPGPDEDISLEELQELMEALSGKGGPMNGSSRGGKDISPEELKDMMGALFGNSNEEFLEKVGAEVRRAYNDAKYEIDQSVVIRKAIGHPVLKKVKLKNFVGRVLDIEYNEREQLVYIVSLDSLSLKKLPKVLLDTATEFGFDFQDIEVFEKDIAPCAPRDTIDDTIAAYRKIFHQYNWTYLEATQIKRLQKILLADPTVNDDENWKMHLLNEVTYPFNALIRGHLEMSRDTKITVTGVAGDNYEVGIIMHVKAGKQRGQYPLFDLYTKNKKSPAYYLLEDYFAWQDAQDLDDDDDDDFRQ